MKKSCNKVTAVIPALLLVACVDNRNDFTGASTNSDETTASLPAPENLSATASDNEVNLSWDAVDGASAYNVYIYNQSGYIQSNYSPTNFNAANTSASAIVSTNSHLLSSLEYEVDYYFNVTALADDLESSQSNEVGVRPLQNVSNSTPYVQLLDDSANAAEVVTLSAEVSDPDGNNISYLWQQTSGASVDIIDGNESEASFTAPTVDAPVELGFALTVFDNLGASSTSSATVTVSDNLSPQVDAGADQSVSPGATVDLLGSASDSDGSVVDIAWQQESGSIVSLSSNSTLDTSFTAPSANSSELTLVFRLSVTDDRGASVTDTVSVIVAADQATTTVYRVDVAENSNGTIHVATTNDPEQESLTFSLSGTDANDFSIDSSSGAISFISTPDYEVPIDTNTDNAYELTFEVSNGTTTTLQELVITVIDVDEAPTITSAPDASTPENTTITYTASATDPENTPLSYSLSGTDAANFSIDPSSGAISFTTIPDYENPADADANNVYALTLAVSDSTHTTSQALSITVTNIDEPPTITSAASANILENTTTTIYTVSASDPENGALSYSLSATDAANFSIDPSSGAISFVINPDYENPADADANNIYELTLEVSDSTHTTSQALAITVDDTNDNAPIITAAQSFSIDENSANGSAIGTVVATDVDTIPTTYQDWTITSGDTNAAFAIDSSSGELSVAAGSELDHESTASYTLALSVSDGVNTASAETLSINVNDVNDNAPIITAAQSFSIDENSANGTTIGTVVATDADTIPTTYQDWTITSGNTEAAFAIDSSSGELSVATSAELDYESTASYTLALSVSDGVNSASAETLSINLSNVNEQPSFTSAATASANENDSSFAYTASAIDVDAGDSLAYSISGGADAASFTFNGASLSFIAAANYESPADSNQDNIYEVELQVTDAGGLSDYLDLQISVANVNEAPSFISVDATVDVPENTSGTIYTLEASDTDSDDTDDTLTYSIAGGADKLSFSLDGAELSFINPPNYEAPQAAGSDANIYIVELSVSDDEAKAAAANLLLSFQVTDANEAPSFTSVSATYDVAENTSDTIFTLAASDVDSGDTDDTLTYSIAGGADRLSFSLAGNELSFAIPPPDYENPQAAGDDANIYTVELAVSDDDGKASETNLALSFNVTDVNEAPTITSTANTSILENTTTTIYNASATDPENDTLTYSLSGTDQDDFIIDPSSGTIAFAATPNYEAPTDADTNNAYQITLEVSDGNANSASQALTISVTNVNEKPTITSATSTSVPENTTTTIYTATTTDPEDDTLTYSLSGTDQDDFIIDPSSGAISFVNKPDHESPTDADTNNVYQVTLEVSDGSNTVTQELTFTVTDSNEHSVSAPIDADGATNQIAENAAAETPVGITVSASDADGTNNSISYSFASNSPTSPDGLFGIDASTGVVSYNGSAALNYESGTTSYSFDIYASSSDGSSAHDSFTVAVIDINEDPVSTPTDANTAANEIAENSSANALVGITASAIDPDGTNNAISYSFTSNSPTSPDGLFDIDVSTGVVSYNGSAALNYESGTTSYSFDIYASSSDGSSAHDSFTVEVIDINEDPVSTPTDANTAANEIAENSSANALVGITVSATDPDGTNNAISYSFASNSPTSPDGLFGIDASTGVVSYNGSAALNYESGTTSYSFDIYASSSDGSSAHDSFTVAVIDINEDPVSTPTDANTAANEIAENSSANALVGITASAIDPDGTNNAISYSFTSNSPISPDGLFDIDVSTGVVSYNGSAALNYESGTTSYSFDIYASSSDGSSAHDSFTVEVIDINEDPVSTPTDANTAANEIAENSSANALVGITVSATDPDGTNNAISYSFASNSPTSPDGLFDIDASTGVVSYNGSAALNYESGTTSYSFDIYASSSDGSSAHDSFTVAVIDINEDPVSTPTDANTAANEIAENSSANALVGITVSATDPDGTNNAISYSFASNSPTSLDGLFDIDASTGVVSYNGSAALNYESGTTSYSFDIYASSSDGSSTNDSFTVEVIDINEDPVSTPTDANTAANEIAENSSANALVGITVSATDPDGTNNAISYSFASNSPTSPDGLFDIDTSTGVVSYNASGVLNYESGTTSYSFDIYASSSDGSSAHDSFTVEVIDINEDPVSTPTDANTAANEIAENSSANALVGITVSATDPDGTNNAISYSFASNSPTSLDGLFDIDASTGVVSYNGSAALNYESGTTSYSFDIYASSSDGSSTNDSFTVEVIDINEDPVSTPTDANTAANEIAENSSTNALVGITVSATDPDGTNNAISYSFASNSPTSPDGLFDIDTSTGVVSYNASGVLNYESGTTSYSFDIYASSSDGSSAHDSFTVEVIDINEDPVSTPTDANTAANEIAENSSANALVGITASAIDPDGTNNAISYSFASNSPTSPDGLFDIDVSTGVVSYNGSGVLNYESGTTSYGFDIYASSSDGSSAHDSFTVAVIDINEDPVSTPTDANTAANEIAENSSANALVGITASAIDPDGTNNAISYSFTSNSPTSPDGLFDIDASTGVVSYNGSAALNYESGTTSYSFDIYASSSDGSSTNDSFTVEVIDINEDPVSTPTDANTAANEIAENSSANALVGITVSATDPDGTNNAISYSFASNSPTSPDGLFDIDTSTGVVSYNASGVLNYESGTTSYSFDIYASSSDGSSAHDSFTVEVIDINEDPVSTPTDANTAANEIAENSSANALVGITASAIDPDGTNNAISYSFASNSPTSPDGLFDIDASTGVVSYNGSAALNYESGTTSYSFDIYASSSDGSSAHDSFTVEVIDINEDPVSTPTDANTAANEIAENSSANALVGITASAIDPDGTNNAISYSFASNSPTSPDGLFDIDASTGVVSYNGSAALNYESGTTSYSFDIYASSSDGSSAHDSFTVEVIDINEDSVSTPTDANTAANEIAENSSANALVGITASASDPDGTNNAISYSFAGNSPTSPDGLFDIDTSTGVVSYNGSAALNYESGTTSYSFDIYASSSDGSSAHDSFTVEVIDINEDPVSTPTDANTAANEIAENSSANALVGITASASDPDGTNNAISYSFAGNSPTSPDGLFDIDTSTGVVSYNGSAALNYESGTTSYSFDIYASSSDGSSATHTFTVSVIDVDEFNVVFATEPDADSSPNQIAEDAAAGTPVGITAAASDDDGTNNTVSYSFDNDSQTSADNLFSIASDTGIVTIAASNSLDYETATSHDIAVKASSSDGSSTTETFTINVTDINDNTPIITASQSFDIDEASANGTSVGTVGFTDADSDAVNTFTWSITAGNTNNAFAINPSTGELTVNTSSELDYEGGTILYTLALTVSDGATTSAAEEITINILDVSEHDAAPSAAYLGLPDNYINITFTPESGVSYQLHRSFVEGCISSSCDAEGYKSFASPNSSGTADTMTFSQTHYYSLVGDNSTTFTTSINDSDGAKLAALIAAQSLTTEYDLANDWVNISSTDSNNVTYTLYMAGEPFAAGGCEDSELDNISSLCADGSSLSDGSMHSATEVINWSARRYYRLDISDGYQVVHSLESNASVIDPVVLNASNASLTIDITWSALNSAKLAEYTVYLSDDSAATTASAATWSSLSNPQIISGNSSELYSLIPILSQYYVAITATNTENETTPLSKVYLVNNIVTGDPDPSTWHEIIADTDDSPAHWEGRSTHGSLVFQDKMWLIGGRTANEAHIAEVWSSTDGYNWTEVNPSAAFGARREFVSMVHDGKMWVLGGDAADVSGGLTNDVWYSSDGANWHEATEAASWHARDYFGGVSFASGATGSDEMWVLGHYTGDPRGIPGVEDHHYSTDGSTWSSVSVSGLPPSSFFPAITFNNAILIVGGYFYTNSAWSNSNTIYSSADGVNWTELSVSGSIWDARRIHTTLVYDDKLWVLAGDSGYNRDDYWYSSDGTQWHEATASGSKWEARSVHTSVNYAGRMWMLGGYGSTGDKQLNDVWASGLEITSFSFQEVLSNSL